MGIEEMKAVDIRTVDPESLVDVTGILISDDMTKAERATEFVKQVSNSIANQNELVMDYLKSHPEIQISDTYVDDGYSGVDFERPEFQRMLSDIRENKINCVVVLH